MSAKEITLIFPDQLFEEHPALKTERPVYIAEEFLFFKVQAFHKQKLVLLRASMKAYADFLIKKGYTVFYIDSHLLQKRGDLFALLAKSHVEQVHLADFADDWLLQDLKQASLKQQFNYTFYPTPAFLCDEPELRAFFKGKKKYSMAQFYAYQRKKLTILMENDLPVGGKFSFDTENRRRIPKGFPIPSIYVPKQNSFTAEAIKYVQKEFPDATGQAEPFAYPVTFADAKNALADFIKYRLTCFGDYEDAITQREPFLFHSVLSPLINIGLLTPKLVVEAVLASQNIPINSLEGYIRQVIGWREFMRACYILRGKSERSRNYFTHTRALPKGFWDGTTGIVPVDNAIKQILKTGYCHHIERLMVLGNFLLLTECHPDAIYGWFMQYFVDSYDWVMVPNVYAMSQYADGGGITTKPYISGANYILKMSDYPKGEWVDIWDGLFWRFMSKHKALFEANPRTKVLLGTLSKNSATIGPKITKAEEWLKTHT